MYIFIYNLCIFIQIYKNTESVASNPTPDVLKCDEMRRFWLSWSDKTIRLHQYDGQGTQLITWSEEDFMQASALALSSGPHSAAEWIIDREACEWKQINQSISNNSYEMLH